MSITDIPSENAAFAQRLKDLMDAKGWHAAELARRSNSTKPGVSRYLRGHGLPDQEHLIRLAAALEVPPESLLKEPGRLGRPQAQGNYLELARTLQQLLTHLSWSRADLAQRSGISQVSLANYLRGRTMPERENLRRLGAAFGLSVEDLLAGNWQVATGPVIATPRVMDAFPAPKAPPVMDASPVLDASSVNGAPQAFRMELLPDDPTLAWLQGGMVVSSSAALKILAILVDEQSQPQARAGAPSLRAVS